MAAGEQRTRHRRWEWPSKIRRSTSHLCRDSVHSPVPSPQSWTSVPKHNKSVQSNLGRGPRRVAALSHTYVVKSPLVTMACLKFAPKVPLPVDRPPNRTTCLMPGPVRPMMPNGIRIRFAVFLQCTAQTDRRTYARTYVRTDRSSTGKFDDYGRLRSESDAA